MAKYLENKRLFTALISKCQTRSRITMRTFSAVVHNCCCTESLSIDFEFQSAYCSVSSGAMGLFYWNDEGHSKIQLTFKLAI